MSTSQYIIDINFVKYILLVTELQLVNCVGHFSLPYSRQNISISYFLMHGWNFQIKFMPNMHHYICTTHTKFHNEMTKDSEEIVHKP